MPKCVLIKTYNETEIILHSYVRQYRGEERRGEERRGEKRRGEERRGEERRGEERRGEERRGEERRGEEREGEEEREREESERWDSERERERGKGGRESVKVPLQERRWGRIQAAGANIIFLIPLGDAVSKYVSEDMTSVAWSTTVC